MSTAFDHMALDGLRIAFHPEGTEVVAHVLEVFLRETPPRVRALQRLQDRRELVRLRRTAHHLSGSSAIIGAQPFASLCRELERAEDDEQRNTLIARIEHELELVVREVRAHLAGI